MTKSYHIDFIEAMAELLKMTQERDSLETKIARQKKRVAALAELVGADDDAAVTANLVDGITDACRTVLRAAERPLLPTEVRDRVQALGFPPQANLLASVYTVLKRLKDSGEAETFEYQGGSEITVLYRWAGKPKVFDALEKALLAPHLPSSAAAQRQRLVDKIREIKEKSTFPPPAGDTPIFGMVEADTKKQDKK